MFAGFQRVYIFGDGDKAGEDFSKKVNESLTNGVRISMPAGQDINDFFLANGQEALINLLEDL